MKTGFLFFVADHLLVSQLCTNPKSDRSLLSCLKVTQCSMSEIGDAPLYNSCSLPIQVMTTGPLPAPSKCKSGRFNAWGHSSAHRTTLWRRWSGRPHHAISHLPSRVESQHQSVPGCIEEWGDPLVQSGGRWQTLGLSSGLGTGPQVQRDRGLASERVLRLCTLLSLAPSFPDLNPLDYFVWSYVENITNMIYYNTKARMIGGWRQLHWIDVSSNQVTWMDFFDKSFKIKL